jgi:DNA polymerase-3 subunit alpha
MFRLLGLVTDAQHKISKQGNKYGSFVIEDYSGKTEMVLWSDDFAKFSPFLVQGSTVFMTGCFRQRYNRPEFEFKVMSVSMADTLKRNLTKQVHIDIDPKDITSEVVSFIEKNVKNHPGKSTLKFTFSEPKGNLKISLLTMDNGFEMNDEMTEFLESKPEFEVQVITA